MQGLGGFDGDNDTRFGAEAPTILSWTLADTWVGVKDAQ
jgi:hypothetical protein